LINVELALQTKQDKYVLIMPHINDEKLSRAIEEMYFRNKEVSCLQRNGNYMEHEPQSFANRDGVLVVKALKALAQNVNDGDLGVAHLAQNKLELNRLARRGTHGVVRHNKPGQRRIGTANQ
jgi:hypothetical protein